MISALRQSLLLTLGTILAGTLACDSGTAGEQRQGVDQPMQGSANVHEDPKVYWTKYVSSDLITVIPHASADSSKEAPSPKQVPSSKDTPANPEPVVDEGPGLGVVAASDRDIDGQMGAVRATLEAYNACSSTCTDRDYTTPTNRESCMLRCRNRAESAGITPESKAHGLIVELDACTDRCEVKDVDYETNRETCHLNCDNAFSAQSVLLKTGDNTVR